jgi:hypothetical protein
VEDATTVMLADVGLAIAVGATASGCMTAVCGAAGVPATAEADCCCVRRTLSWLSIAVMAWDETPAFFRAAISAAERL